MKRKFVFVTSLLFAMTLGISNFALAQNRSRTTERQVQRTLTSLETRADAFRKSLDYAINRSRYSGTAKETEINRYVSDFEQATDRLLDRFRDRNAVAFDVDEVLARGWYVDRFMKDNYLSADVQRNWRLVRTDLLTLARQYNVQWRWDDRAYNPSLPYDNYNTRLTGTYALNVSRSDNVERAIENATRGLNRQEAERVKAVLLRRMEAPERIAIDRKGYDLTIVSTNAPQVRIEADGRGQTETRPNGRTVTTTASLSGDTLTIVSTGDRADDFNVVFQPIDNGRSLRVTKRIYSDRLAQPVEVRSIYNRTSDVAQLNIYDGNRQRNRNNRGRDVTYGRDGRFVIADGTALTATLNENLTTKETKEGDRFTMTINSPGQYRGGVIEGSILKSDRSGRVTGRSELTLEFERVRVNGRYYDFDGIIESVRTPDGEDVKIDNEGAVKEDDSQTERTITRSGIGAAIGAIIGGITGGGKGAAIGAVIGAGAGAGTVLVQGRDDLNLNRGTEFTIRASAPRASY